MKLIPGMIVVEAKNTARDPLMIMLPFLPLLVAALFRIFLPTVASYLNAQFQFELRLHYPFIVTFFFFYAPVIYAIIIGFNLLDEKDDQILQYVAVTPLAKNGYVLNKLLFPSLVSFVMVLVTVKLTGLADKLEWWMIFIGVMAALETPILTLLLAILASDKVAGMALAKAAAVFYVSPFIGYLLNSPFQLLAGILPNYWMSQAYLVGNHIPIYQFTANDLWFYIILGLAVHLAYLLILLKIFIHREQ